LKAGPFTLEEARRAGVSPTALRGSSWIRLHHGLYCWSGLIQDPWKKLTVFQRLLPTGAIYSGCTAAWALGMDLDPFDPIEVVVPSRSGVRSRPGLIVRRSDVGPGDVVTVRGMRVTSVLRTLSELCPRLKGVEALALMDAALRLKLTDRPALIHAQSVCVRLLGPLAEPAESRMETRLRWLLLKAGLPRPEVQRSLHDSQGRFIGRADLYYDSSRLVVEFDGGNHRDRLVEDNRRQNKLMNGGYTVLRFTASDVFNRPDAVVAQVSAAAAASARRPAAERR
jgi:very-short-patch-repair endonuclease